MGKKMRKPGPKPTKKGAAPKKDAGAKGKYAAKGKVTKVKQPSARALRFKKNVAPKVIENTKNVIFLRGTKTSEAVGGLLKDLSAMRKPFGKMLQRKNENMHPFEDPSSVEFLSQKNDCSIFAIASHSKKRPDNLVVGRTFNGHLLDMVELGIESSTTIQNLHEAYPEATVSIFKIITVVFTVFNSSECLIYILMIFFIFNVY